MNVLLIEPGYKNKYPPIGLMKLAYFHRVIREDDVIFVKGRIPDTIAPRKWDRIYVTSLFTFEYKKTIEAIKYAQSLADENTYIEVGGIAATLMPDRFEQDTGIRPNCGLLNIPGKIGLPHDECIDELPLDYSILDQIDYVYPFHDAYFLSATKGCGMRCGFCAVQKLEPHYIPYYDIKTKVHTINAQFGEKRDLLLMDNNVLISKDFDKIIDDILELGFERGATFRNPKTGKTVQRFVDFNQGLDAKLITPHKAQRLGEIALSPGRIAFDHIEDKNDYIRAIELCTRYGVTEMSNYLLYNSEDFSGKGTHYHADTPENMYARMRISLDLQTRLNAERGEGDPRISIFSFPMRFIPLDATERGYIGTHWNAKYLRALQCMLIPTQGKGVGSVSFFEADFGKSEEDFVENLCMPENLMQLRGHFVEKRNESVKDRDIRYSEWEERNELINEWKRLFRSLGDDKDRFISSIADNEFLPEKLLGLTNPLWQILYYYYLTPTRRLRLMEMMDKDSPTAKNLHKYIKNDFPLLFKHVIKTLIGNVSQQSFQIKAFSKFFGKEGIIDLLKELSKTNFDQDALLRTWAKAYKTEDGICDFTLIRLYRRYVELNCLNLELQKSAKAAILRLDMMQLRQILAENFDALQFVVEQTTEKEKGQKTLCFIKDQLFRQIQLSFFDGGEYYV